MVNQQASDLHGDTSIAASPFIYVMSLLIFVIEAAPAFPKSNVYRKLEKGELDTEIGGFEFFHAIKNFIRIFHPAQ